MGNSLVTGGSGLCLCSQPCVGQHSLAGAAGAELCLCGDTQLSSLPVPKPPLKNKCVNSNRNLPGNYFGLYQLAWLWCLGFFFFPSAISFVEMQAKITS